MSHPSHVLLTRPSRAQDCQQKMTFSRLACPFWRSSLSIINHWWIMGTRVCDKWRSVRCLPRGTVVTFCHWRGLWDRAERGKKLLASALARSAGAGGAGGDNARDSRGEGEAWASFSPAKFRHGSLIYHHLQAPRIHM